MPDNWLRLKRSDHYKLVHTSIEDYYRNSLLVDCTLAAEGQCLKAHKVILSACSTYFMLLFTQENERNPIIILKDVQYEYLKMVLDFVYVGEVRMRINQFKTFLEVAASLKIKGLDSVTSESHCENTSPKPSADTCGNGPQVSDTSTVIVDTDISKIIDVIDIPDKSSSLEQPSPQEHSDVDTIHGPLAVTIQSVYSLADSINTVGNQRPLSIASSSSDAATSSKTEFSDDDTRETWDCMTETVNSSEDESEGESNVQVLSASDELDQHLNEESQRPFSTTLRTTTSSIPSPTNQLEIAFKNENFVEDIDQSKPMDSIEIEQVNSEIDPTNSAEKNLANSAETGPEKSKEIVKANPTTSEHSSSPPDNNIVNKRKASVRTKKRASQVKEKRCTDKCMESVSAEAKSHTRHTASTATVSLLAINVRHPALTKRYSLPTNQKPTAFEIQRADGKKSRPGDGSPEEKTKNLLGVAARRRRMRSLKLWPCTVCKNNLSSKASLARHIRRHTGEKPFICTVCEKRFTDQNSALCHMRTHSGERPYECTICNKKFSQTVSLNRHMLIHAGTRPFECLVCHKKFTQRAHMVRHTRTHTLEKPYQCSECKGSFSLKGNLITHIRTHTGEKPYKCSVCDKRFAQQSTLARHKGTHKVA